jgi:signal peptidase II
MSFFGTVLLGTLADQWTKAWVLEHVRPVGKVTLVSDVLDLVYTENAGAFFSLGASLPEEARRPLLVLAGVVALGLIAAIYRRTHAGQPRLRAALALLAAGAVGNLVDRIVRGSVIDFVHLHVGTVFRWATFNVADVAITAGLLLLLLDLLRPGERAPERAPLDARPSPEGTH